MQKPEMLLTIDQMSTVSNGGYQNEPKNSFHDGRRHAWLATLSRVGRISLEFIISEQSITTTMKRITPRRMQAAVSSSERIRFPLDAFPDERFTNLNAPVYSSSTSFIESGSSAFSLACISKCRREKLFDYFVLKPRPFYLIMFRGKADLGSCGEDFFLHDITL
jgi:hypothetical protein